MPGGDEILKNLYMKRGKSLTALVSGAVVFSLVLASMVILPSPVAAVPWEKHTGNVTLLEEGLKEWGVVDAWVIKDGPTSYKMWYTHAKTNLSITGIATALKATLPGTLFSSIVDDIVHLDLNALLTDLSGIDSGALYDFLNTTSTVIGYATSSDGVDWTVVDAEVLAGGGGVWDSVGAPNVVKTDNSTYEMWYTQVSANITQGYLETILTGLGGNVTARKDAILSLLSATSTVISYATSVNGTSWTPVSSGVLTGDSGGIWDSVTHPNVVKTDNSTYEMWYTLVSTNITQGYLETILTNVGTLTMSDLETIFNGSSTVIKYATSGDGILWNKVGSEVLAGGSGGIFDSVGAPSVAKTDNSTYEMWYTQVSTNITLETDLQAILDAVPAENITALWTTFGDNMTQFLIDFVDLIDNQMDPLKALLANTTTVIGYATSDNGTVWAVQDPLALVGANSTPWSSVGRPSVIVEGGAYEMWYTKGIDELTAQNLVDFLLGDTLPIGYATGVTGATVEISVVLQGSRPDSGWVIPLNAKFYTPNPSGLIPNPGDLIHSSNQTTVKSGSTATANFTPGIAPGTYDITVFSEHTMVNIYQDKVIAADYTFVDMGTLQEGDCNNNGFVNIADFFIFLPSFGKSPPDPAYNPMADFNRGGFVNIADFFIFLPNFGDVGPFDVTP